MSASFIGAKISGNRPSRYENSEPGGKAGRSGTTSSGLATARPSYARLTVGRSHGIEQTSDSGTPYATRPANADHDLHGPLPTTGRLTSGPDRPPALPTRSARRRSAWIAGTSCLVSLT